MANTDIKTEVMNAGLRLWQIADRLNMCDSYFSRLLRHEFSQELKDQIRVIISDIKNGVDSNIIIKIDTKKIREVNARKHIEAITKDIDYFGNCDLNNSIELPANVMSSYKGTCHEN